MMKKAIIILILASLIHAMAVCAAETPQFTVEFRGVATIGGEPVPDNTEISIWAGDVKMGAAKTVEGIGYFNHLEIKWDDPKTDEDEGVAFDDTTLEKITFSIGERKSDYPQYVALTTKDKGKTINQDVSIGTGKGKQEIGKGLLWVLLAAAIIAAAWFLTGKKRKNKAALALVGLVFVVVLSSISIAGTPPYRTIEYRGIAKVNGTAVSDGTIISIWANNGTLKMDETETQFGIGFYDHLEIVWDDLNTTGSDEGVTPDETTLENITFKIGGVNATTPQYVNVKLSERGDLNYLDLDTNYTLNDTTAPVITLVSPANDSTDNDGNITFVYTVDDAVSGIANCSLIIDGAINQTNTSITEGVSQNFSGSFSDGDYEWSINCTDNSTNLNTGSSETRIIHVSIAMYNVTYKLWNETLTAGMPTGINVSVKYLNGTPIENVKIRITEKNGYTPFALPQRGPESNVTNYAVAETFTHGDGMSILTIVPTGGADLIGFESYVGNYSLTIDAYINDVLINTTTLNVSTRALGSAYTGVVVPNADEIDYFKVRIYHMYQRIKTWIT